MEKHSIENFTKGWFIGDFEPSLFQTDLFESAAKYYKKGDKEASHHHKIATEYTIVGTGRFIMGGEEITSGDIIVKYPGESADFECLEDGVVMVVKVPCAKGDKYID